MQRISRTPVNFQSNKMSKEYQFKAMLSATARDLADQRHAAEAACIAQEVFPVWMKHLPARDADGFKVSMEMVDEADIYIGIYAWRYGWVPDFDNPRQISITELEFDRALARKASGEIKEILIFIMDESVKVSRADIEMSDVAQQKLKAFRERASKERVVGFFKSTDDLQRQISEALAAFKLRHIAKAPPPEPLELDSTTTSSIPTPPAFYAAPDYIGRHTFIGRKAQLKTLTEWAQPSDPTSVLLFEAIGGNGKSMLTWEWATRHATAVRADWAGRFWYSFYEKGAVMRAFCQHALAYMTQQPLEAFEKKTIAEMRVELVALLRRQPWLLILDGLERVLVAYHRIDAAEVADEEVNRPTDKVLDRDPCDAIRDEDTGLLRALATAAPSKILISSRLTPRALLNQAGIPLPGVKPLALPGLDEADAEELLRSCGIHGTSADIRYYLTHYCGNHPLVIGLLAGLINSPGPHRGNFDNWAANPEYGAKLDLASLDLIQSRNHILRAAMEALEPPSRELLSTLALLSNSVDYETVAAFNPHLPPEPEEVEKPVPPEQHWLWDGRTGKEKRKLRQQFEAALAERKAYEDAIQVWHDSEAFRDAPKKLGETIQDLEHRGLLQYDPRTRRYDLHPVVRGVVAGGLIQQEKDRYSERISRYAAAAEAEAKARNALSRFAFDEATSWVLQAIERHSTIQEQTPEAERLRDEFGFLLSVSGMDGSKADASQESNDRLRWCTQLWQVVSSANVFSLRESVSVSTSDSMPDERGKSSLVKPIIKSQSGTSESLGDTLEDAVSTLFRTFFQLGDDVPWKIRKQKRGTQGGFDVSIEWSGKCDVLGAAINRCHIECKNYKDQITPKDVADKLLAEPRRDPVIEHWILLSPRSNPSNELNRFLEQQIQEGTFPFDVQVWSPETGVASFFGLEPAVYDLFFEPGDGEAHPREWDDNTRDAVRAMWRKKLEPPLRLPPGWADYTRDPALLCIHGEDPVKMARTFENHVPVFCRNQAGMPLEKPLHAYVQEWLDAKDERVLFLLGEFGDGKSFYTYLLARALVLHWLQERENGWLPLRLSLRKYSGNPRDFLRERLEVFKADVGGWTELGKRYNRLVILDGFDEMSVQLDPATITSNIKGLLECCDEFEGCKILITSRTHFFQNRNEAQRLLSRVAPAPVYMLAPVERGVVVRHVLEAVPVLRCREVIERLNAMNDPIGLASKPLFLDMLKEIVSDPDLPQDLDVVTLYERYLNQTLRRKAQFLDDPNIKVLREETLANLRSLLGEIAEELQRSGEEYVRLSTFTSDSNRQFAQLLWKLSGPAALEEDAKARVGVRSLLERVPGEKFEEEWCVNFFHRSIREYLVSCRLCDALKAGEEAIARFLSMVPVNHEIIDFAVERWRKLEHMSVGKTLLALIRKAAADEEPSRISAQALTLLVRLEETLPRDFDWTGKKFDGVDLEAADLSGMNFSGCSFRNANMANVNFEDSDFSHCDLSGVRLEETKAVGALCAHPSGEYVVAAYGDGVLRQWELKPGTRTPSRIVGQFSVGTGISLGIHETGQRWLSNGKDWFFFDAEEQDTWRKISRFQIRETLSSIIPDGGSLAFVEKTGDGRARVVLADLSRQVEVCTAATESTLHCAGLSADGVVWSDASMGFRIYCPNPDGEQKVAELTCDRPTCLDVFKCTAKGYLLAAGTEDGRVHVWEIGFDSGAIDDRKVLELQAHDGPVTSIAILTDSRVASGGVDCAVVVSCWAGTTRVERRLRLRMKCKGMRIEGLRGETEYRLLETLVRDSSEIVSS
jgi:hypothetical protein